MTCSPMHTAPPLVDLADRAHPAQSLSVKVVTLEGISWYANLDTSRGLPRRYLPIFLSRPRSASVGALMFRAASLTA